MTTGRGRGTIGCRLAGIADRLGTKIAITERDAGISYGRLYASGIAIARCIVATEEHRPGSVCLLFESKIAAITAMFGAGQCGRSYIPLDAGDPDERLRFILQDSQPIALLTEETLLQRARALAPAGCSIINVERLESGNAAFSLPDVAADALVYLFYTSGSTGKPKGVCQTHQNLLFFVDAYAKRLCLGEDDRLSLLYSLSFSGANMDIFGGLLNGATLCAYDLRRDGIPHLADWLDRERITVLHSVPTVFRELMNSLAPERKLVHLRAIDLGGESVFDSDVALFRRHTLENCVLINHLAATEASVIAQHVVDHRSVRPADGIVPVGHTPDGLRVLIQRADGSEADSDEIGEIVVSSPHVSPGYWRRPELNASAFAADPQVPGWRRYLTGDLGHVDQGGNLHFLGRKGSRIKIRGHSVDLTEVEAAICAYSGVTKAAVLAVNGPRQAEPERLVAYIAVSQDVERNPLLVRRHLATLLPSYMQPARFLFMDALPLTASGKIDRKALTQLEPTTTISARTIELPQGDLERAVARIFEQLLKVGPIGRDDDFFFLGGDSLMGVELQIRLRDSFGVHVANFHEDATVAAIAATIRRDRSRPTTEIQPIPVLVPLWRNGSEPPLFLVHGRNGQAFVSPHFMRLLGNDQPVWAFQARGLDGLHEPHSSVEDMAAEYLAEMRKQRPHGPYFLGSLCAGAYIAAVMARSLLEAGDKVLPLLVLDPPNRIGEKGYYDEISEERFVREMKGLRERGRTAGPVEDPAYMNSLRRTVIAFEHAIAQHRPQPYDGPVYVLSSHERTKEGSLSLRRIFTGRLKRYEVGESHSESVDPGNPVFAGTLQRCVGLIREAARTS
jgi:amino acid adenylation domain-containing protein